MAFSNAGLSWVNYVAAAIDPLADPAVTLTATGTVTGFPVTNLVDDHLATVWRMTQIGTPTIDFDLGIERPIGAVGLFGLTHTSLDWRVTLSTVAPGGTDVLDTGTVDADLKPGYRQTLLCPEVPVMARYGRITLSNFTTPQFVFPEAGSLWVGDLWRPSRNFRYGDAPMWVDPSEISRSRGGQVYVDVRDKYRTLELEFEAIARDEAWNTILEIDRIAGIGRNLLFVPTPGGEHQNREALLGRIVASTPAPRWAHGWHRKRYVLEERL
jgi:hypothetical protein